MGAPREEPELFEGATNNGSSKIVELLFFFFSFFCKKRLLIQTFGRASLEKPV